MRKKSLLVLAVLALSLPLTILMVCSSKENAPYVIGVPVSLTGANSQRGVAIANAVKLQVEQTNKKGGINGHDVTLQILDDKSDASLANTNMLALQKDPSVLAIIGRAQAVVSTNTPQVTIANPAPEEVLNENKSQNPWLFRLTYSQELQQRVLAAYILAYEPSANVLVVNAEDSAQNIAADDFEGLAKKANLKVKRINITNSKDLTFDSDEAVSVVLFAPEKRIVEFIKAIHAADPGISVYGDHRIGSAIESELKQPFASNVFGCVPFNYALARFESVQFKQRYEKAYGASPSAEAALAFDAISITLDAIGTNASPTRETVRAGLARHNSTETGFPGITARVFFDEQQHTIRNIIVEQVFDSELRPSFRQLRFVPDNFTHDKEHKIIDVDGYSYFKQMVAYIGMDFYRLEEVAEQKDRIDITAFMWLKWHGDPSLDSVTLQNAVGAVEVTKLRNGTFAEEVHALPKRRFTKNAQPEPPVMYAAYKVKLPVQYQFQLAQFPFDTQTFPITIGDANRDFTSLAFVVESDYINDKKLMSPGWEQIGRQDYAAYFYQESTFGSYPWAERNSHQRVYSASYEVLVKIERVVFGYLFSLFVPLLACLFLCFLTFSTRIDDVSSRLAVLTGAFFVAMLSHMSLRTTLGVSYLVAADVFYFITYGSILAGILAVNFIEKRRQKDVDNAVRVQHYVRLLLVGFSMFAFIGLAAKLMFSRASAL